MSPAITRAQVLSAERTEFVAGDAITFLCIGPNITELFMQITDERTIYIQ